MKKQSEEWHLRREKAVKQARVVVEACKTCNRPHQKLRDGHFNHAINAGFDAGVKFAARESKRSKR